MAKPENPKVVALRAFPKRLDRARKEYEITNEIEDYSWARFALAMGFSTTVMSQVKTGQRPPTLKEVVLLANHLGVRPEWLAFGSGDMLDEEGGQGTIVDSDPAPAIDTPTTHTTVKKKVVDVIQPGPKRRSGDG